jgi:hypothetical protein
MEPTLLCIFKKKSMEFVGKFLLYSTVSSLLTQPFSRRVPKGYRPDPFPACFYSPPSASAMNQAEEGQRRARVVTAAEERVQVRLTITDPCSPSNPSYMRLRQLSHDSDCEAGLAPVECGIYLVVTGRQKYLGKRLHTAILRTSSRIRDGSIF